MFYNTVRDFSDIVISYTVTEYRRYGTAMSFIAKVEFFDRSVLFIRDYLFKDGKRKYSYHWQDKSGSLLSRWDNAPHHKDILSYPHHRHLDDAEVVATTERNLPEIFSIIRKTVGKEV
jgi:hypothetical protein